MSLYQYAEGNGREDSQLLSLNIVNILFQATKSPFYLHVGREILENLNQFTRTHCGYATVHSVSDMSLEDRMESFFLSETAKYLYLVRYFLRFSTLFVFGHLSMK